jgi:hypothetical protein
MWWWWCHRHTLVWFDYFPLSQGYKQLSLQPHEAASARQQQPSVLSVGMSNCGFADTLEFIGMEQRSVKDVKAGLWNRKIASVDECTPADMETAVAAMMLP